ncbi:MAG: sigma-70 family RNA polymerase sigma factor [Bacteroidota bacterium]
MQLSQQQQLVIRLGNKDKTVIAELYDRYGDTLYGIILRIVQQEEIAKDVLQEAFVKIWKNGPSYDATRGTLFTWMLNICRNTAIDKTRSANYRRRSSIGEITDHLMNDHNHSYETKPELIGLTQEVNKLQDKYREIIELIYFKGYTQQEVTEKLNLPLGTVMSRVRIGLRELKKVFLSDQVHLLLLLSSLAEQLFPITFLLTG